MPQRYFHEVSVGDPLGELAVTVSRAQMFLFSAATNNSHRIHYDRLWATEVEGLRDVVVHGPLHGALMTRLVTDWMGPGGRVVGYAVRHEHPAFADETLHCAGSVTGKREQDGLRVVDVDVTETNDEGTRLGRAQISVILPARDGRR